MENSVISAYVTNLGKYNEGVLMGEWVKFPTTIEQLQETFKHIGIDGIRYEEFFITDYETDIDGLTSTLGEYENLDEVNYLALKVDDLDDREVEKLEGAIVYGEYSSSIKNLINLTENLECYSILSDVQSHEDLGYYYVDELMSLEIPENIQAYFDYEAYGRDIDIDGSGLMTDKGYVEYDGGFMEVYSDLGDIPHEYRICGDAYSAVKQEALNGMKQVAEERKPENHLKIAEMSTEQNYNQIDGIINNEHPEKQEKPPNVEMTEGTSNRSHQSITERLKSQKKSVVHTKEVKEVTKESKKTKGIEI